MHVRTPRVRWPRAVLLAAWATIALGGAARAQTENDPGPADGSTAKLEATFRARADSARMRFTEADVRFMTGMITHHAQAVAMARLAPSHGASPSVQTLAARILNAQEDEIATMQQWLRHRGQPVPEVQIEGTNVIVRGTDHVEHATGRLEDSDQAEHTAGPLENTDHAEHMPGMLTLEQIQELDRARGPEFDRLFLTYMIQHHQGAVIMVRDLFAVDGAGQDEAVFKFASDVQVDQKTEIARMELMLSALPAEGSAP